MGRTSNKTISPEDRSAQDRKLTLPGALTLVLLKPRIPQNTGSIARLCAATGSRLDLIAPLFKIDDSKLRRAGLDYWPHLDVRLFESLEEWLEKNPRTKPWYVEVQGTNPYSKARFAPSDAIFFGDEQEGLPLDLLRQNPERSLYLPQQNVRSLNLAMCAGIVCYEALRQIGWPDALKR